MVGWPYFLSGELYGAALRYDRRMDYHFSLFPSCPPLGATSPSSSHAPSLSLSLFRSPSFSRLVSSPSLSYFLHPAGLLPAVSCKKAHPTAGRSLSIPSPPLTKTCKAEWAKAGWWEWWLAERTKPKEESRGNDGCKKDGAALDCARNGAEGWERERKREWYELAEYPRNVPFSEALFLFPSVVTNTLEFSARARDSSTDTRGKRRKTAKRERPMPP